MILFIVKLWLSTSAYILVTFVLRYFYCDFVHCHQPRLHLYVYFLWYYIFFIWRILFFGCKCGTFATHFLTFLPPMAKATVSLPLITEGAHTFAWTTLGNPTARCLTARQHFAPFYATTVPRFHSAPPIWASPLLLLALCTCKRYRAAAFRLKSTFKEKIQKGGQQQKWRTRKQQTSCLSY